MAGRILGKKLNYTPPSFGESLWNRLLLQMASIQQSSAAAKHDHSRRAVCLR
jgi:hypothetical protein